MIRRCLDTPCNRQPVAHGARCENHLRALLSRIFGPAEWRL